LHSFSSWLVRVRVFPTVTFTRHIRVLTTEWPFAHVVRLVNVVKGSSKSTHKGRIKIAISVEKLPDVAVFAQTAIKTWPSFFPSGVWALIMRRCLKRSVIPLAAVAAARASNRRLATG
jgi:hypothetical protein